MELEEMKSAWSSMSDELDKQKKLNRELISEMIQRKSKGHLNNLIKYEGLGMFVMSIVLIAIAFNLDKITGWINIICTIATLGIFAAGAYLSASFIRKAQKIDIINNSVKQVHQDFNECYLAYQSMKKNGILLGVLIMIFFLPVASIIMEGKDLTKDLAEYTESLIAGLLLFPIVIYLIFTVYNRNMNAVKKAMEELEE